MISCLNTGERLVISIPRRDQLFKYRGVISYLNTGECSVISIMGSDQLSQYWGGTNLYQEEEPVISILAREYLSHYCGWTSYINNGEGSIISIVGRDHTGDKPVLSIVGTNLLY